MNLFVLKWNVTWPNGSPQTNKRTYWSEKQARKYLKTLRANHAYYKSIGSTQVLSNIELLELTDNNPRSLPI